MSLLTECPDYPSGIDGMLQSTTSFLSKEQSMNDVTAAREKTSTPKNPGKVARGYVSNGEPSLEGADVRKSSSRQSSDEKISFQRRAHSSRHRSSGNRTGSPTASAISSSSTSYGSSMKFRPRAQSAMESSGNVLFPRLTSAFTAGEFYSAERPLTRSTVSLSKKSRSGSSRHAGASRQHAIVDDYLDQKRGTIAAVERRVNRASFTSAPSTRSGSSSFSERSAGSYRAPSSRTSLDSLVSSHIEESDEEHTLKQRDLLAPEKPITSTVITSGTSLASQDKGDSETKEELHHEEVDMKAEDEASYSPVCYSSDSEDVNSNGHSSEAASASSASPPTSPESVRHGGPVHGDGQEHRSDTGEAGERPSSVLDENGRENDTGEPTNTATLMDSEKNEAHRPPKRKSRSKKSTVSATTTTTTTTTMTTPDGAVGEACGYPGQPGQLEHDVQSYGFHSPQPQRRFACGPYMSPTYPYEPSLAEQVPPYDVTHAYPSYPYHGGYMLPPPAPDHLLSYTHTFSEDQPAQQLPSFETSHQHAPEMSKKTSMGYDLLAYRLTLEETSPGSRLKPMYRKFERLNHRVLLHLQSEICELEEELKMLDNWVSQSNFNNQQHQQQHQREREANHPTSSPSSTRSADPLYDAELQYRRTELLGRIFIKLGQYNQGLSVYSNMAKRFEKAEVEDVRAYQSWLADNRPMNADSNDNETESRLLDEYEDLICLRKPGVEVNQLATSTTSASVAVPSPPPQSRRQSRTTKDDSMGTVRPQVATIGLAILLLIPFLTFHVIPSSLGRLFIVLVAIIAQGAMVASTPVGAYLSENEWVICAVSYVTVAFVAGLFLWT